MELHFRNHDWSQTPLASPEQWAQSLKTAVGIMLNSKYPMFLAWGDELAFLYNDGYRPIFGHKHPAALGQPFARIWAEVWDDLKPLVDRALAGEATWSENLLLFMERSGYSEEVYFTFSYSPVRDESGRVAGMFCACTETTQLLISERRLALLRDLGARTANARTWQNACEHSCSALASNARDLPFALLYLAKADGSAMTLAGTCGIEPGHPVAPEVVARQDQTPWPLAEAALSQSIVLVDDLRSFSHHDLPTGDWKDPPNRAAIVPLTATGGTGRGGVLVAGLNPYRSWDDGYANFLTLVAGQLAASIASAEAYEEEKKRAEALAELDRGKTLFFSNASHEFRTPLTLMLGPVEDMLSGDSVDLAPETKNQLEVVHRNSLRLLKLVNTMLDFSRIEAGRTQAKYEPVDLAAYTAELASVFRAAMERAGLRLIVDCRPLPEPVYVDRDMWEKIVLNFLSNAFKFTFEGEVAVCLEAVNGHAKLIVRDTGVGIPAEELPRIFERFHRVTSARGRTHEGTGIGLALVLELVKLHGGTVHAESALNEGSEFTITIPFGKEHLDPARIGARAEHASTRTGAEAFIEEAMRWLPETELNIESTWAPTLAKQSRAFAQTAGRRPRVVWADDNADMRDYVARLLSERFDVEAVADGQEALEAARSQLPDLVLSDVMMPRLDGIGLLAALRSDPQLHNIPTILLSARAGEEARIEGMNAGADDYLIKPFSARELLARVDAQVRISRMRAEMSRAVRESEARQTFLLNLSDALKGVTDAQAMMRIAAERLGRHLGADRAGYADVDPTEHWCTVSIDWTRYDMPSMAGSHQLDPFGPALVAELRSGRTVALDDACAHPLIQGSDAEKAYRAMSIGAAIAVPLVKGDRLTAALFIHLRKPRTWTQQEVLLARDVAERTWDAIERARAEEALQLRSAQLETLVNHAPLGVYLVDSDFRIIHVNPVAMPVFGNIAGGVLGRGFDEIIRILWPEEYADEVVGIFRHTLQTGEPYHMPERAEYRVDRGVMEYYTWRVHRITLPDGGYGVVCYFQDISAQVNARLAIAESEARYRTLFDSIDEGFCVIEILFDDLDNPMDFRWLETNPAFERHTGIHDVVGKSARQRIPGLEEHWVETYGRVALTGKRERFVDQSEVMGRWFEVDAFRIGRPEERRVALLFNDVTSRKQAEADLQRAYAELEQRVFERTAELQHRAVQLARLTSELSLTEQRERQRLAQVLHDHLQQLLVAAKIQLGLVARNNEQDPSAGLQRVKALLKEAIEASRSLTVELAPPILREAGLPAGLEWLARWFMDKHGLTVAVQLDERAVTEREDVRILVFQSVRELLFNVVKHAGVKNATLSLDLLDDSLLRVTVTDRGRGIDSATRADGESETGFGLFSIRERLSLLGGRLEMDSVPGEGTRFTILAPTHAPHMVADRKRPPEKTAAESSSKPSGRTESQSRSGHVRILLVDDHKVMREGLRSLLSDEPELEVAGEAANGVQAIEQAHALRPDVILMDFSMPEMNGVEAAQRIKADLPHVNIIGLSMYDEPDRATAMLTAGASAYFTKSGDTTDLLHAIRAIHPVCDDRPQDLLVDG